MNKKKFTNLIFIAILFCGFGFTVSTSTETVEFETITETLTYNGDKSTVPKLIITGEIFTDYSESSEWRKFRILDETFQNIEAVEILTSQDIPDWDWVTNRSILFYKEEYDNNGTFVGHCGSLWLKNFSAPNVKWI